MPQPSWSEKLGDRVPGFNRAPGRGRDWSRKLTRCTESVYREA